MRPDDALSGGSLIVNCLCLVLEHKSVIHHAALHQTAKKHLKMTNPGEVRRAMTRVSNMVLNGEITPQQANALIYAGNAVLSSIRADEQERRLTELEAKLTELEGAANETD